MVNYLYPKPFHGPLCFNLDLVSIGLDKPQAGALRALCTCQTLVANDSGLPSHWQTLLTCTCTSITPPDADTLLLATISMSLSPPTTSSSNLEAIFNAALTRYKKKTKKDLLAHPLAPQLQVCQSPSDILAVLRDQIQNSDQTTNSDESLMRCLDSTVNVLYSVSGMLGGSVGEVISALMILLRYNL